MARKKVAKKMRPRSGSDSSKRKGTPKSNREFNAFVKALKELGESNAKTQDENGKTRRR